MAGRDSSEEEEHWKKRKKKEREAKALDAQEAQLWAEKEEKERKEREEDKHLAWEKLLNQLQKEKYSHECPELTAYRKKHITMEQMESINLDDHTAYLNHICLDKSQYPYRNVMSCRRLLDLLEEHGWQEKVDKVRTVIDKGLNSYAPTRLLSPSAPVIEPKFFIRVIQKSNGKIIDRWEGSEHRSP